MKNIFYILLLLPTIIFAQYPSNSGHKITLGEQTTADGLIYRGVLGDTLLITPSSDTSAYIILDTVNHRFYNYNRATNVWSMAGVGSISSGLTGVLPVANGGTGSATKNFVDLTNTQTVNGVKTFINNINFDGTIFVKGSGSAANPTVTVRNDDCGLYSAAVNTLGFATNGTEAGRISPSRNWLLGVGMTDGDYKLDVNGDTRVTGNGLFTGNVGIGSTTNPYNFVKNLTISAGTSGAIDAGLTIQGSRTSNDPFGGIQGYHGTNRVATIFFNRDNNENNSGAISFLTSSSGIIGERMRIASNGNVGIGTTSPQVKLEIAQNTDNTDGPTLRIANNANTLSNGQLIGAIDFYNGDDSGTGDAVGAYIRSYTADATLPVGSQYLSLAAGGSTERMRITSGGNVGIGLISPASALDVLQEIRVSYANANQYRVRIFNTDGNGRIFVDGSETALIFGTSPVGTNATATEKMRITSTGNVGIGTASPGSRLVVKGVTNTSGESALNVTNSSDASLLFVRNDGRIGMGTSTPEYRFVISNQGAEGIELDAGINQSNKNFIVNYNRSTGNYIEMQINASKTILGMQGNVGIGTETPSVQFHTTGDVRFATFAGGGTTTLSVDNNGNLARTSSIELKNNITNIKYGLSDILKINPINFNWKDENKFGNENENGFIAEDVYTIIPNVVSSDNNGIFMDYTKLIPILTKAIQEQNLLIKALEQRIINLENK
jgi:hypothetical protein